MMKNTFSMAGHLADRERGRQYMEGLAVSTGGIFQDIVEAEAVARAGASHEPPELPAQRLLAALEED